MKYIQEKNEAATKAAANAAMGEMGEMGDFTDKLSVPGMMGDFTDKLSVPGMMSKIGSIGGHSSGTKTVTEETSI